MSAGDATTLRQVSLAALLGLDARVLLTTDEPATHAVYRRVIEQARMMSIERAAGHARQQAVATIGLLAEALGGKKA